MRCNIGIYNLHMQAMGGGEKLSLVLGEQLSLEHNVSFFSAEPLDIPFLEQFFDVDLSRITTVRLAGAGPSLRVVERLRGFPGPACSHHYQQLRKHNLDLFINNSYASRLICPAARGIFMCMFPHSNSDHLVSSTTQRTREAVADWIEKRLTKSGTVNEIDSYSTILAISEYSAGWIRQLWQRHSEIIYPPCDEMGPSITKRKVLLNVARFIADGGDGTNYKNQGLLLDAFKQMIDLHDDGWELHFAGSVAADDNSKQFAESLQQEASGFPVFLHFNATRKELQELYQSASIYWHATGHGSNFLEHPARQEHFGIATVEAMSAGAVPVVYGSGGQKEIVSDGVDGIFWNSIEELVSQTRSLANNQSLRSKLSERAVASSKRFGRKAFGDRVNQLIAQLLSESPTPQ